jgi:DNA-binding transcriptional regulator YiaG
MAGRHSFATLRNQMSAVSRKRADLLTDELRITMNLGELRRARQLSQDEIAQVLHVTQASVAKIERRADIYVSTMRRFIEAMGGELIVTAKFPDRSIPIKSFEEIAADGKAAVPA